MLFHVRRALLTATFLLLAFLTTTIITGRLRIFDPPPSQPEILTIALYLLSTLVQSLAAIMGITIAVVFITAQLAVRPNYSRTITQVYRNPTVLLVLLCFISGISLGVYLLSTLHYFIAAQDYRYLDCEIVLAISSILLLVPLTLEQIENLDPYLLAARLARRITTKGIRRYGLADVTPEVGSPQTVAYRLILWGHQHGEQDPLGAIHEIIMGAVGARDRVQLISLVRLLLKRIAGQAGVPFGRTPSRLTRGHRFSWEVARGQIALILGRERCIPDQVTVALHILHYVVRRTANLRREWGDLDAVRQEFLWTLCDLIAALNMRSGTQQVIELCLYAVMHICLSYGNVRRYGRREPLVECYRLVSDLTESAKPRQAELCLQIVALLSVRTHQLPGEPRLRGERMLAPSALATYQAARTLALDQPEWVPGNADRDPWRYRVETYRESA